MASTPSSGSTRGSYPGRSRRSTRDHAGPTRHRSHRDAAALRCRRQPGGSCELRRDPTQPRGRQEGAVAVTPVSAGSTLALGRGRWRSGPAALALRCGLVALVLGAFGCLAARAVPLFVLEPGSPGVGVEHAAAAPAPGVAARCWTNHTSAKVFLAPWFAPLSPTQGLQSDCSVLADTPRALAAGPAARPRRGSSASMRSRPAAPPNARSSSDPRPSTSTVASTAAGSAQPGSPDALDQTGGTARPSDPQFSAPHGRQSDHPSRDHPHSSQVTVELPVGGLSPLPPLIDQRQRQQVVKAA